MRVRSGSTTTYLYFIAVDSADGLTRKTGLSSFTVVRSRNGAADVTYTTPTITEIDATTMPGVYALLLDEDTTVASGADSEEMALHITATGMVPVTRVVELFRREVTSGETLTVSSGTGNAAVQSIANNAITAASIATDAITAGKIAADAIGASELAADAATEIATAVWASATRLLTAGTNIVLAKGTGVTGFNDLDAAGVRTAVGLASANLDTQLSAINSKTTNLPSDPADQSLIIDATNALATLIGDLPTNAELATALGTADDATLAAIAALDVMLTEMWQKDGLDSANPSTVTPSSWTFAGITITISGDGTTTSTFTRSP